MASREMPMDEEVARVQEPARKPHRCPWWGGPFLASSLRRLLEKPEPLLQPYVEPGMRVLDCGSAMGFFSLPLARMVGPEGRVVCVDVQPRMIAGLERRARKAGLLERIETIVSSEEDLGLSEHAGRIDFAVLLHVLHEVGDIPGTLTQVARALKSGARLLLVEPKGHVSQELFDFQLAAARRAGLSLAEPLAMRRRHAAVLRKSQP